MKIDNMSHIIPHITSNIISCFKSDDFKSGLIVVIILDGSAADVLAMKMRKIQLILREFLEFNPITDLRRSVRIEFLLERGLLEKYFPPIETIYSPPRQMSQ